jgi:pyruvate kinase
VRRRLLLYWGVSPVAVQKEADSEAMIQGVIQAAIREGFAAASDKVVVVAGLPVNSPLTTNSIRVHIIGTVLGRGGRGFGGKCTGRIIKANNALEAAASFNEKSAEILLTHTLDGSFIPIIRMVKGIIIEGSSGLSKKELLAVNPDISYVGQVHNAMKLFEDHITVTLDGEERIIYEGSL